MKTLIITNGDCAADAINHVVMNAEILPWRDVLHDGPVPVNLDFEQLANVRAEFLSQACGWESFEHTLKLFQSQYRKLSEFSEFDEVVLWFEHDLYDQLQLLQILDYFSSVKLNNTRLSLICNDRFVTDGSQIQLHNDYNTRKDITKNQLKLAVEAWCAFTSPNPENLNKLIQVVMKKTELNI